MSKAKNDDSLKIIHNLKITKRTQLFQQTIAEAENYPRDVLTAEIEKYGKNIIELINSSNDIETVRPVIRENFTKMHAIAEIITKRINSLEKASGGALHCNKEQPDFATCTSEDGVLCATPSPDLETAELSLRVVHPIDKAEILQALVEISGCPLKLFTTRVFGPNSRGERTLRVKCPLTTANTILENSPLSVGRCKIKVKLREVRCFRCFFPGHAQELCTSSIDRSGRCFRCGRTDHHSRHCYLTVECPVCVDYEREADHLLGPKDCIASH